MKKSLQRFTLTAAVVVAVVLSSASSFGQTLISDNFEADTSANYSIQTNNAANGSVQFAFDYVTAGIPVAPRSSPGNTNGLKVAVNTVSGSVNSQTVYNNTAVTASEYRMLVDVYVAFQGATATTIYAQPGVGGSGTTYNAVFTPISGDGSFMAFTGDGGSASDYRWYLDSANGGPTTVPNTDPSYLGHGSNNTGAFYQSLFPAPPSTIAGVPGNIWTTVQIDVNNTTGLIKYYMTNTSGSQALIFDNNVSGTTPFTGLLDGLVSMGAHDPFASLSPPSVFVVFDNLLVEVPEPSSIALATAGVVGGLAWRRKRLRNARV